MIPSDQIHPDLVSPIIDLSGVTQNQDDIPDADWIIGDGIPFIEAEL